NSVNGTIWGKDWAIADASRNANSTLAAFKRMKMSDLPYQLRTFCKCQFAQQTFSSRVERGRMIGEKAFSRSLLTLFFWLVIVGCSGGGGQGASQPPASESNPAPF